MTRANVTPVPKPIPKGTPNTVKTSPSKITLFLICRGVAPTAESIPKSFVFSVTDMEILFLIMKMLIKIIINIKTAAVISMEIFIVLLKPIPFAVSTASLCVKPVIPKSFPADTFFDEMSYP